MMPLSQVELLLKRADAFARQASRQLSPEALAGLGKTRTPAELALKLKTHYLFPRLLDWERCLLVAVYWQKEALARLLRTPARAVAPSIRTKVEQLACQMEQFHMGMVAQARSMPSFERLSPLDRAVLETEYFSIEWENGE